MFSSSTRLFKVDLSNNQLSEFDLGILRNSIKLRELDLSDNILTSIALGDETRIERLRIRISGNEVLIDAIENDESSYTRTKEIRFFYDHLKPIKVSKNRKKGNL